MTRNFSKTHFITMLIVGLLVISFQLALAQDDVTPTPDDFSDDIQFPLSLNCDKTEIADGPSWMGIEIGRTTFEDLVALSRPDYDISQTGDEYVFYLNGHFDIPFQARACVVDGIVTVAKFGSGGSIDPFIVSDIVSIHGIPDAVTYATSTTRVAFWFEEGIAAEIYTNRKSPNLILNIILFPYQEIESYETRYPYNVTLDHPVSTSDFDLPEEQNPFDFDAIMATVTVQPTLTPTTTLAPYQLEITPSPTAMP